MLKQVLIITNKNVITYNNAHNNVLSLYKTWVFLLNHLSTNYNWIQYNIFTENLYIEMSANY